MAYNTPTLESSASWSLPADRDNINCSTTQIIDQHFLLMLDQRMT